MKTPLAAALASLALAAPAVAEATESATSHPPLDAFGVALLGAGLSGLALSQLLRRRR